MSDRRGDVLWPVLVASAIALVYLVWQPPSTDLAAATYRSGLFSREGLAVYDTAWYGGHHMPAYSVLFPPLGAWLGLQLVGALSVVAGSWAFALLVRHRVAAIWFAATFAVSLGSNRLPFTLGVALGLGALLAADRGRRWVGVALAVLAALASPLAGAFLALVSVVWRPSRALGVAALATVVVLTQAFPEGGQEPYGFTSILQTVLDVGALAILVGARNRVLRAGLVLYLLVSIGSYIVHSPVGSNIDRLGELFAGPAAAYALWPQRRVVLALIGVPLVYWSLQAPVRDVYVGQGDPTVQASYYVPLERFLTAQGGGPFRLEVPFTASHWDAAWLAPHFPLARGWERQVDVGDNPLFYDGTLDAQSYERWLHASAVRYVALPDSTLDYSAQAEAALIRRGLPYLSLLGSPGHWRVYAVRDPTPLASAPAAMTALGAQDFTLRFAAAGTSTVRLRWTPYWTPPHGVCVARAPGGYTLVSAPAAGLVHVHASFSLARVFARGRRCG